MAARPWAKFRRAAPTATIFAEFGSGPLKPNQVAELALGARLRAYTFDLYKTKRKDDDARPAKIEVNFACAGPAAVEKAWAKSSAIGESVVFARDLVNEPANVLYPGEFARRVSALSKLGLSVEVLDVPAMRKLGMGALLGVGQGSVHDSRLVVMRWNGGKRGVDPVAFIGKGVCFDTGGISIKPAAGMEDMKGDMAGAACVVGLMRALATRNAKVNAVGAIGLVENMPDGKAQRPGDIVKTMSGQTIEIINTDAEGRLVLADVLHYVNKRFKPKFMVNLATLTGAIIVALGQEYAGMFSNDDKLVRAPDQKRRGDRRTRLAHAARARIRQDDRFQIRRHEEYRRPLGRRDHGGAIAAALCRQDAMGASRHCRHRDGFTADRDQQKLGVRLGRAAARSPGRGILRAVRADGESSRMTEVLFYHLKGQTPEQVLPALLQKSLERGWRVVVQASSDERVEALDAHLWTWRDDSFLPHGTSRDTEAAEQPIMLTASADNPNGATVRFLVDGAEMTDDLADASKGYERIVMLFDGDDPDAVEAARARWTKAKAAGAEVTYWRADENGRWQRQG